MPSAEPVLLCEGHTDDAFFRHLASVRGLQKPHIISREAKKPPAGEGAFSLRLKGVVAETGIQARPSILLVADNDATPSEKFEAVVRQIREANKLPEVSKIGQFGIPNQPRTLAPSTGNLPPLAILMMPWDNKIGCLDTLCLEAAVSRRSAHAQCVEQYLACVRAAEPRVWDEHKVHKMKLHCLLSGACPDDPCISLLYAWSDKRNIPADLVPLDSPCFDQIAEYLATLWPRNVIEAGLAR
jgi:hypothetical protein